MGKTVLVTGSSGTVGTALVQELMRQGLHVIPLDIKRSYWDKRIDRKTLLCDLRKPLDKLDLPGKPYLIAHLAAHARVHDLVVDPKKALDNYLMTHNLLELARKRGIHRFLFASSREVYGESKSGLRRKEGSTDIAGIKSPYTATKYGGEAIVHAYECCYGIKSVVVRLSNVYGRYDVSERAVPLFLYYALRNRDITIFGSEKKLDFTFIDDAVSGLVSIIKRFDRIAGNTFNISAGKGTRVFDVARIIVDRLDSTSEIKIGVKRTGEISSYIGDITRARKLLDYNPKVTIEEGLTRNIEWYREVMRIRRVYESQRRNLLRRGWA